MFGLTGVGVRRIPLALLRGKSRITAKPATLLLAGHQPWIRYIPQRMFQDDPEWIPLGNLAAWRLPGVLERRQASADLCVARIDRLSAHLFFGKDFLRVPEWVGARLEVPEQLDRYIGKRDGVRSDVALVKRQQYHPLVTQGAEGLETFYDTMYVPFGQNRHGDLTFLRSLKDLRQRVQRGGILWVCQGEQRLAGLAFQRRRDSTLDLLAVGTAGGDVTLIKQGAIAAVYYYSLDLARQLGCTLVDLRGSRPSLLDGLLRYKAKWGATLYDKKDSYHDLLLSWETGNEIVEEFLTHTPVIFRDGAGYSGLCADPSRPVRSLWIEGLQRIYQLNSAGTARFRE